MKGGKAEGTRKAPEIRRYRTLLWKAAVTTNFKKLMGRPSWGESAGPGQGLPQVGAHGHPGVARENWTSLCGWGDGAERKVPSKAQGLGLHSPGVETMLPDRLQDQETERGSP